MSEVSGVSNVAIAEKPQPQLNKSPELHIPPQQKSIDTQRQTQQQAKDAQDLQKTREDLQELLNNYRYEPGVNRPGKPWNPKKAYIGGEEVDPINTFVFRDKYGRVKVSANRLHPKEGQSANIVADESAFQFRSNIDPQEPPRSRAAEQTARENRTPLDPAEVYRELLARPREGLTDTIVPGGPLSVRKASLGGVEIDPFEINYVTDPETGKTIVSAVRLNPRTGESTNITGDPATLRLERPATDGQPGKDSNSDRNIADAPTGNYPDFVWGESPEKLKEWKGESTQLNNKEKAISAGDSQESKKSPLHSESIPTSSDGEQQPLNTNEAQKTPIPVTDTPEQKETDRAAIPVNLDIVNSAYRKMTADYSQTERKSGQWGKNVFLTDEEVAEMEKLAKYANRKREALIASDPVFKNFYKSLEDFTMYMDKNYKMAFSKTSQYALENVLIPDDTVTTIEFKLVNGKPVILVPPHIRDTYLIGLALGDNSDAQKRGKVAGTVTSNLRLYKQKPTSLFGRPVDFAKNLENIINFVNTY